MDTRGNIIWLAPDRFDQKPDKSTWLEMARCLSDSNWKVTILTGRKDPNADLGPQFRELVTWLRPVEFPFLFRISLLFAMARWLRRNASADDIIVMNEDALWLVPFLQRIGIRFIHLDFRTLPVDSQRWKRRLDRWLSWRFAIRRFAPKVQGYSFITERLREEVEREFALNATDYVIWQSGVNTDRFKPRCVKRTGDAKGFRLFYHGSISRNRGLGLVIDAIALGGLPDDFRFVIVGDGVERADLERQARELGVDRQVEFRGFVPYEKIVDEICQADVCICPLPDRLEWNVSSPLKVFEYMACGKPMILTPIPAHEDVVGGRDFVLFTKGLAPRNFLDAIIESVSSGPARCADAGRALVCERYDWRVQALGLHRYLARTQEQISRASRELSYQIREPTR